MYKSISLSINFVFSDNSWPPNFLPFDAAGTFFIFKLKTENNSKIITNQDVLLGIKREYAKEGKIFNN